MNQWSNRPSDERFWTVEEMADACFGYYQNSKVSTVKYGELRVEADSGDIRLVGKSNIPATLTHYGFGQMCQRVKAPAGYLRQLPATLAAQNINHGLKTRGEQDDSARLLLNRANGHYVARCMTSLNYKRVWNYELANKLIDIQGYGWRVAPARPAGIENERSRIATEQDCLNNRHLGLSIQPGDTIAPAGLYASDKDMFVFMVDDDHVITNPLSSDKPLARGFFLWNSEVGDRSIGAMTFLYNGVCGNHIVWGAQDVKEFRFVHVGGVRDRAFGAMKAELMAYADSSASDLEAKIKKSQSYLIGDTYEETINNLVSFIGKKRIPVLNRSLVEDAYEVARTSDKGYGDPRTPWAITQGLTELSQRSDYADKRVQMDRAAGRVMEIAF
jgi:hypothetical protein